MSQENVERVRKAVEAMNGGDFDAALSSRIPTSGGRRRAFPDAGTYRGPEEVLSFFQTWLDTFEGFRLQLENFEALDEHRVLAILRVSGEGSKRS